MDLPFDSIIGIREKVKRSSVLGDGICKVTVNGLSAHRAGLGLVRNCPFIGVTGGVGPAQ